MTALRFGLVGTGYWAREVHAVGVAGHSQAQLAAVWGRDAQAAGELAAWHGARAYARPEDMFDAVDAVVFAVPPDVQAPLAAAAATAGCHLLLEKPVALDLAAADEVVDAVEGHGVASVVFFTERFVAEREEWLTRVAVAGAHGARASWLASLDTPDNPFAGSQWRREHGALLDVGPHALSVLLPVLGPVTDVVAVPGRRDLVHLVLTHADDATSVVELSLTMPPAAKRSELAFYDDAGWHVRPDGRPDTVTVQRHAVSALIAAADAGAAHPCDARFGRDVVAILERAAQALASR